MTAKMHSVILKDIGYREVLIKTPSTMKEVESLTALNLKWQRANVKTIGNGFLSGGHFPPSVFMKMAEQKDTVVGIYDDRVVSYYTVNSVIMDGVLANQRMKAEELKLKGFMPKQASIAVGVQIVVDKQYQGSRLAKFMLDCLVENTKDRFDYFYTSISKKNEKSVEAHKKTGWVFVDQDENLHHLIYDLGKHTVTLPEI